MTTPFCRSCGFPMRAPEDYAGNNPDAEFCSTCAEVNGSLKPFDDVVLANANYFVREQGVDQDAALEMARALLMSMPAWKKTR
jgi:hypothetical protein